MEFEQLSRKDIENKAEKFLSDYFAECSTPPLVPIPIESIAEHYLGYEIEITDDGIFANPAVLGGIIFDQKKIIINAATEVHEGRYSFTLAHEIAHHVLHKAIFEAANSERMMCREDTKKPLQERQADHFAGALLMPQELVRRLCRDLKIPQRRYSANAMKAISRRLIKEGNFTNVSNQAMIVRLHQLGHTKETVVQIIYKKLIRLFR